MSEATEQKLSVSQLSATLQSATVGWIARDPQFARECMRQQAMFRAFTNHLHSSIIKGIFELVELDGKWDLTNLKLRFEEWWPDDSTRTDKLMAELSRCMRTAGELPLKKLKDELAVIVQGTAVHEFVVDIKGKFAAKLSDADRMITNAGELDTIRESVEKLHEQLQDPRFKEHAVQLPTVEERLRDIREDRELRHLALSHSVPFLHDVFEGQFSLSRGLVLIGGRSGTGKSTTLANILAYFIEKTEETGLVISNEESAESVCARVACCLTKEPFHEYINRKLSPDREVKVNECIDRVVSRIIVFTGTKHGTYKAAKAKEVLERTAAKDRPVGMVLIDYYQTMQFSDDPKKGPVEVLKDLGFYLKEYAARVAVPVVAFVQLKPEGSEEGGSFSDRVQNDKTVYNHAQDVIEILPDFKQNVTKFQFHKGRFLKRQDASWILAWKDGRYERCSFDPDASDEDVVSE